MQQTQSVIAMVLYFAGMALAVFASAGLVSAVFEPGRIELLLSKPVSRTHLLLGRYAGNVLVVAANILYLVARLLDHLRHQDKRLGLRASCSPASARSLFSAVLLAVIVLVGVLWDSAAIAIMATFAIMIVTPILAQKTTIERLLSSEWSRDVVRVLYYAAAQNVRHQRHHPASDSEPAYRSWMPVWSTAIFGVVVLGLGLWRFQRRSF